jgi:hypothetical protein
MSYFVLCTFDLIDPADDSYQLAYSILAQLRLNRVVVPETGGTRVIPTTTVVGHIEGPSAATVAAATADDIKRRFVAAGLKCEMFVTAGGPEWRWEARRA